MPKYEVQVSVILNPLRITYVIEADNMDEARKIAEERGMDTNLQTNFVDIDDCELICKPRKVTP